MNNFLSYVNTFIKGGGETGTLLRTTELSALLADLVNQRPHSFFTALSIILHAKAPMLLCWGPQFHLFYNDAFRPFLQPFSLHPQALGQPADLYWPQQWSELKRLMEQVITSGEGTSVDYVLPRVYKDGEPEERAWSFGFHPVYDESGMPAGVIGSGLELYRPIQGPTQEQERYRRMLDSMTANIALIDKEGNIVTTNKPWLQFSHDNQGAINGYLDRNYLDVCQRSQETEARQMTRGIQKVISGELAYYNLDYACHSPSEKRWFRARVSPLIEHGTVTEVIIAHYDITEQKVAELQTQKALLEKQKILDASVDVICAFDQEGRFVQVNKASREIFGYESDELLGIKFMDMVFSQDQARTQDAFNRALASEDLPYFENRYIRKDGSLVPIVWKVHWDSKEQILYCIGRDETQKKEADKQLVTYSERFTNILESITDGFITLDKHWQVTYWNNKAEYLLNMPRQQVLGKNLWHIFQEAIPLKFYSEYQRAVRDQVSVYFEEYLPSLRKWFDVCGYPSEEGLSVYFKDITSRKQAEEQIRIAKERYDLVAKATHDAIWDWDLITNDISWGDGYRTLFGYDVKEVIISLDSWEAHIHPEDVERVISCIRKAIQSPDQQQWNDVYRFIRADGSYATIFDRGFVIRDQDGRPLRMIGAMQDITQQKEREQEREQLIEELTQNNLDLRQFTYITSHNFRAPLSNLMGLLDLMKEIPIEDPLLEELLEGFKVSTQSLHETINDLVMILMIKERPSKVRENIRLRKVFEKICQQISIPLEEANAEIAFNDSQAFTVYFDRSYLESIFLNLLTNSIKYRSLSRRLKITITTQETDDSILMYFQDNGIGIDVERYKDRLFGLYQRFHERPDSKGLGLYLIKSQIRTLGGEIDIESQVDVGTTFGIRFKKQ